MDKFLLGKCQYFFNEDCPYQSLISKAVLIPQLLDPCEIKDLLELCHRCEKCQNERRTSLRIKRPFRVGVTNQESTRNTRGITINISTTGTLIQLDEWPEFEEHEIVKLEIYSDDETYDPSKTKTIKKICTIERTVKEKNQMALSFIKPDGHKYLQPQNFLDCEYPPNC